jgi:hypothetical protein
MEVLLALVVLIVHRRSFPARWVQDDAVLIEVLELEGVIPSLVSILMDNSPDQEAESRLAQVGARFR